MIKFLLILLSFSGTVCAQIYPIKYPFLAEQARITGYVKVKYDVNEYGRVENIRVLDSSPKGVFEREVVKGMKTWTLSDSISRKDIQSKFVFTK